MNDRMLEALAAAGLDATPLSLLDHASAQAATLFALYDQELVYLEGAKNSRVALRDVTRIHSDREGILRVETSSQTAVTASLLGYDPGRVQTFFQQVRDVTARAKELPVLPLSVRPAAGVGSGAGAPALPGSGLPGSSLPSPLPGLDPPSLDPLGLDPPGLDRPDASMPGVSAYTPAYTPAAAVPVSVPPVAPVVIAPVPQPASTQTGQAQAVPVPSAPVSSTPVQAASTLTAAPQMQTPTQDSLSGDVPGASPPAPVAAFMPAGAVHPAVPRPEPVIISSMPPVSALPAFQERAGERNRQANRAAPVAEAPASSPARRQETRTQLSEIRTAEPQTSGTQTSEPQTSETLAAHTQGPLVSVSAVSSGQNGQLSADLLRRADSVQALARTVGLLAVVLGLAALALAVFQWNAGTSLGAIWTLLTGGVGTVALLAFAEALRLLSALARSQQA